MQQIRQEDEDGVGHSLIQTIKDRIALYREAEQVASSQGEGGKARRAARGLKTLLVRFPFARLFELQQKTDCRNWRKKLPGVVLCQKLRSRPQSLLEEGTFYSGCSRTLCHLETYFRQDAGSSAATSSETSPSIEQALPPVPSEPAPLPIRTSPPPPTLPARQTPPPVRRAAPPTQPALPPSSQAPVAGKKYSPVMSYTHAHCTMNTVYSGISHR